MNLDRVVDYGAAWTFTDAFKASRDWFTLSYNTATGEESWSGGGTPVIDAKGWPTALPSWANDQGQLVQQRLATLMYREISGNYPAGVYRAQWAGTGTLSFGFDARVIASGLNPDGTRWADLNVTPSHDGILLKILEMPDPADPIRDLHVWVPDYNGQRFVGQVWQPGADFSPFHPLFVERLSPFKTLRFMDWQMTNTASTVSWSDRRAWDEANQTGEDGKGVALEYMVALANQIDADVWFNMPHQADDDFVRNFASYVKENLEPGRQIKVEWSNEIWNWAAGFHTFHWITQQLALPENAGLSRYQFAAGEIKRDFDIWSEVFADDPARLTRVLAGQAANPVGVTEELLKNMEGKYDAVSCTGYFGLSAGQRASFNASTTPEQIASAVLANVPSAVGGLRSHRLLGQQYAAPGKTIKVYAYEAGQHADALGNANLPYLSALHAAQTHPTMYEAYDDFVRGFYEMGGDLAMHYTYVSRNDKNGSWGALQSQTQPTANAPKYRSLLEGVSGAAYVPEYAIAVDQAAGEEFGNTPVRFRITRTGDKSLAQTVSFALGGTASAADYVNPGTTIHFAAGQATALLTIVPVNDTAIEDTETLSVTLVAGAGYKVDGLASRVTATATIADDDASTVFNLPIQNGGFETGDFSGWTKVPLTNNAFAVAPAADGTVVANGPVGLVEGARYAWGAGITGSAGGGAANAGIAQTFNLSAHAVGIDSGNARLNFSGYGAGWGADYAQLEVRYYNASGTQIGSTLTSNKATNDRVWVKLTADTAVPALTRSVELRATANRTSGNISEAGVDALSARFSYANVPTVNVTASDAQASEPGGGKGNATFTVMRSGPISLSQPLTVHYALGGTATAGLDYASPGGTLVIPAGSSTATITVTPLDDVIDEREETVTVSLVGKAQYLLGASTTATATIADDDLPRVLVTAAGDATAAEAGQVPGTFVIERLTEILDGPLTVRYTLAGTAGAGADYQPLGGSVTIPAGEALAVVTVVPVDDATVERDESVVLNLSANAAYTVTNPASAVLTIVNDDHPRVTVTASDANASEAGPDPATFTFTRTSEFIDDDLTVYFTLGGTALQGEDYTVPATGVTIPAGELSASVTITPLPDADPNEGDEAVVLALTPGRPGYTPGVPSLAVATIADGPAVVPNTPPSVTAVYVSGSQWSQTFKSFLWARGAGDTTYGYRIAPGLPVVLPWVNLDRVSVRFSENVDVTQDDLLLRGVARAVHASGAFTYDPMTFTATWTLAGGGFIPSDKLLLDLNGGAQGVRDGAGAALGDYQLAFGVLPGDVNSSGAVNGADVTVVTAAQGAQPGGELYNVFKDPDGSGAITAADLTAVRTRQGLTLPAAEPQLPPLEQQVFAITDPAESVELPGDP